VGELHLPTCENCGRLIGRLETAHLHGEHVVCAECRRRLASPFVEETVQSNLDEATPAPADLNLALDELAQASRESRRVWPMPPPPGYTICPICGAVNSLYRRQKADMTLAIFLLIFLFPVWIIYRAFTVGEALFCRHCGAKVADV
jgi:predicted RNA-binding Zn-ribbon protein involved in translation (DUF1610 family)